PAGDEIYEYMSIYNGIGTSSGKLFENGNKLNGNQIPGPFVSTDNSGAITVRFVSDPGLELKGWAASINCNTLGLADINNLEFKIFPNPTTDFVNITTKENIVSYQVYDMNGKLLVGKNKLDKKEIKINLESYPKGIYLLNIQTDKRSYTQKVTRK
uniref:T9SS type A sorting domain-containing protein n=1 Tax=uncultured Empedobacter sp. TaxID=410844 RepID=UPI00262D52B8